MNCIAKHTLEQAPKDTIYLALLGSIRKLGQVDRVRDVKLTRITMCRRIGLLYRISQYKAELNSSRSYYRGSLKHHVVSSHKLVATKR